MRLVLYEITAAHTLIAGSTNSADRRSASSSQLPAILILTKNEGLLHLRSSPNVITIIKSKRVRWAGHVARMGGEEEYIQNFAGRRKRKKPLGRPRRSERILLK
jgi:hypothetical protein